MNCDLCPEKASVYLTQIVDGQIQKVNMCEACAKAKGVTDPTGFALADVLLGVGTEQSLPSLGSSAEKTPEQVASEKLAHLDDETTCQHCGFTHAQFKKTGRLGCSKCYQVFGSGLESLLKAMHKGTQHVGKVPARHRALLEQHYELDRLRTELDEAVEREAFEEAAGLRDQILEIESEMKTLEAAQAENSSAKVVR